ncbi:unnamed protein product, partial [Musa acuminata var. zebrina]
MSRILDCGESKQREFGIVGVGWVLEVKSDPTKSSLQANVKASSSA